MTSNAPNSTAQHSSGRKHKLTVLIPCCNEENNIADCIESVRWADEIFIVDSFSTDSTLDIAGRYTERIVQHEYVNSARQKNWAIPQATHEWVLVVDADERVTPELRDRIERILSTDPPHDAYNIKRMSYFFGKLIRHCGWHKDYLVRLFKRDAGRYEDIEVHADVKVPGSVGTIHEYFTHYTDESFAQYFEKFDRYTALSAADLFRKGVQPTWLRITIRPMWRFFRMYILRLGFLDGLHGLILCGLSAMVVFTKYARLWEMRRNGEIGELPGGKIARARSNEETL